MKGEASEIRFAYAIIATILCAHFVKDQAAERRASGIRDLKRLFPKLNSCRENFYIVLKAYRCKTTLTGQILRDIRDDEQNGSAYRKPARIIAGCTLENCTLNFCVQFFC